MNLDKIKGISFKGISRDQRDHMLVRIKVNNFVYYSL